MVKRVIHVTDPEKLMDEYIGETIDGSNIDVKYIKLANQWLSYNCSTTASASAHKEVFSNYRELFREEFLTFL